jgi:hypothetical protein
MRSMSDAILIVPQEHSSTTQQLEAWMGLVAKTRKKTSLPQGENKNPDGITIPLSVAHSLDISSPRQFRQSQCAYNHASKIDTNVIAEKITKFADPFFTTR